MKTIKQAVIELAGLLKDNPEYWETNKMKKETLEEAAVNCWAEGAWDNRNDFTDGFIEGAKWQQERSYSEEEVVDIAKQAFVLGKDFGLIGTFNEWFETVKKK